MDFWQGSRWGRTYRMPVTRIHTTGDGGRARVGHGGGWWWVVLRDLYKVTSGGFCETLTMEIELREAAVTSRFLPYARGWMTMFQGGWGQWKTAIIGIIGRIAQI